MSLLRRAETLMLPPPEQGRLAVRRHLPLRVAREAVLAGEPDPKGGLCQLACGVGWW